jgi:hypothetical protein
MPVLIQPLGRVFVAALLLGLAACASPRYQTVVHHEPPADAQGQSCVVACAQAQADCRAQCQAAWQACTARVEPQVEERYAQALRDYELELRRYHHDLSRYEWDLWLGWSHWHGGLWYSPWPYGFWPEFAYRPLPPAGVPTRESVRSALHKAACQEDCGCESRYDGCFTACGGKLVHEKRCVANCPPAR